MSGWTDRIDFPQLGPGWVRLSKPRPVSAPNGKQIDHMYVAPSGQKFRSIKQAAEYVTSGADQPKPLPPPPAEEKRPKRAAAAQRKPAKQLSPADIAKAEAAREAKKAELQLLNASSAAAVCFECGSGDETRGNDILLCDGVGCNAAYHCSASSGRSSPCPRATGCAPTAS